MTAVETDTNPRKLPRQTRAKATVEAILTATAQVLVARGYERTTTARVAERAGVSVGSLYQYFPNKEALVAALIELHAGAFVEAMRARLRDPAIASLEAGLAALIDAAVGGHRLDPALHKILNEQVPRVGRLATAMDTARQITVEIERLLRDHPQELRPGLDPALAATVIETSVEALIHRAVIEYPELMEGDRLAQEAFCLVAGYAVPRHRGRCRHCSPD